jgi:hypothetical protein
MNAGAGARLLTVAWVVLSASLLSSCGDDASSAATSGTHVVISGTPARSAFVGRLYSFMPRLAAPRGAEPLFTITNKPSWSFFDAKTGQLSGTPATREIGIFQGIQISVTSGPLRAALPPFSITVTPPNPVTLPSPVAPPDPVAPPRTAATAVTVSWLAPTDNINGTVLTDLKGYKIHYGGAPRNYSGTIQVSNPGLTTYVVENLSPGRYYFAVTAYNSLGEDSDYSPEISTIVD